MTHPIDADDGARYDEAFYAEIGPQSAATARAVVPFLADLAHPTSVVDVGCGTGAWLAVWAEHGATDVLGLDGDHVRRSDLAIDPDTFRACDLEHPPELGRSFDLAMSVEVAEHLAPESADRFVTFLTSLAPVVLFSAAVPGQGGVDHVNEQWPAYWSARFARHGYRPFDIVRPRFWVDPAVTWYFAQNLVVFAADDRFAGVQPALPTPVVDGDPAPLSLVHPTLARDLADRRPAADTPGLATLLRRLPPATAAAVRSRRRRSARPADP